MSLFECRYLRKWKKLLIQWIKIVILAFFSCFLLQISFIKLLVYPRLISQTNLQNKESVVIKIDARSFEQGSNFLDSRCFPTYRVGRRPTFCRCPWHVELGASYCLIFIIILQQVVCDYLGGWYTDTCHVSTCLYFYWPNIPSFQLS